VDKLLYSFAGYGFALLFGTVLVSLLSNELWRLIGVREKKQDSPLHSPTLAKIIGIFERVLYVASWQIGKPEFIGLWLVLKTAGGWKGWAEDRKIGDRTISARHVFTLFLIGSGLSLMYAVIGALIIGWLECKEWIKLIVSPIVLIIFTLTLWFYVKKQKTIPKAED
jgi:hypothetical protein